MNGDRRKRSRGSGDRRRSKRWQKDELLRWRVYRGRRARCSHLIERSLDGLILEVKPGDEPAAGARVAPYDRADRIRLGFRSAVVTRTEAPSRDVRLVFVEIEA